MRGTAVALIALAVPLLSACGGGGSTPAAARSPHTLRLSFPVGSLAAHGKQVAAAPTGNAPDRGPQQAMEGVLWDASTGRLGSLKLPRTCANPWGTSLAGSRMAVVCDESCCAGVEEQVVVTQPVSGPVTIMRVSNGYSAAFDEIVALTGGGKLLLFVRDSLDESKVKKRVLYLIDGTHAHAIRTYAKPNRPWLVAHGLVLVPSPFGEHSASVLYDGGTVDQVSDGRLRECFIGQGTALGGVSNGYVAYTTADAVHVIRMRDCRDALIADRPGVPAGSAITAAGLFYVFDARPIRISDTNATMARIHSTLTFVPMARLERLVSRGLRLG